MRFGRGMMLAVEFAVGLMGAKTAHGQASVYADFSASKLTNLANTYVLVGPTVGVSFNLVDALHLHLGGDLRGSFLGGKQRLDSFVVGPRASFRFKGFDPYAEVLVGFGRYNDGLGNRNSGTSDGLLEVNAGFDRKLKGKFDLRIFEFGYAQYYALGGQFNPKTFSSGVVYHLGSR